MSINDIYLVLREFTPVGVNSPFNYIRNLICDKAAYFDAFVDGQLFPPFEVEIQMSSLCNLKCRWCIGDEITDRNYVKNLPNNINKGNVMKMVRNLMDMRINGLGLKLVKFSGFIGEPLHSSVKEVTLDAIKELTFSDDISVGFFTNGVFMTEDTWNILSRISYVHVSLDSGPSSFYWLKEPQINNAFSKDTFNKIIRNIEGLNKVRIQKRSDLKINVGYVIVPGNHDQIYKTAEIIQEAGADSIRFKCDIGERFDLQKAGVLDLALEEIEKVKEKFGGIVNLAGNEFSVYEIHKKEDIEQKRYKKKWNCESGCYYQSFLSTIGSDGNVYLCDHNSIPGAIPLGNIFDEKSSFQDIWMSKRRNYLIDGIEYICKCEVCPPFGNEINPFLHEIVELRKTEKLENIKQAIELIRQDYEKQP
jgi:sulfatase maturation enzyme AslB (radical SAM superfamily)